MRNFLFFYCTRNLIKESRALYIFLIIIQCKMVFVKISVSSGICPVIENRCMEKIPPNKE